MTRNDEGLARLAAAAGLAAQWTDAHGKPRQVEADSLIALLQAMGLDPQDPDAGLHALGSQRSTHGNFHVADAGGELRMAGQQAPETQWLDENGQPHACLVQADGPGIWRVLLPQAPGYYRCAQDGRLVTIALAPSRAPTPAELLGGNGRGWGIATQLYSLRQADGADRGACGFGDFAALAETARAAAAQGAQAVAISPVHAGFASAPERYSPYSPSSRLFLNVLYGNPGALLPPALLRLAWSDLDVETACAQLEADPLIDWPSAAAARLGFLRAVFQRFEQAGPPAQLAEFERYCQQGGQDLLDHAIYEGLAAHHGADWRDWPQDLRDPRSAATAGFAAARPAEVRFHLFAQWVAAASMQAAQQTAREAGMRIGLIADLAIGTDPRGSQAWSDPLSLLPGVSVGAPPDILNTAGQDWGLTAFSPQGLRASGYAPFIRMLRASLAQAGGVRIDHILGLARLWLVPPGASAADGAYLHYPIDDLLRLTRLEAWRHGALIIGENLGTVPEGFDDKLAASGLQGMNVLWFMNTKEGEVIRPDRWPPESVAMTTTHDLPTLRGWWRGLDLDWRERLGQYRDAEPLALAQAQAGRDQERDALWQAVCETGPLADPRAPTPAEPPLPALLGYVASACCPLAVFPLEDIAGLDEQPNLPNSGDEHPNWRRRMPADTATLLAEPGCAARIEAIRLARGRE